jgi:hypothetical protein
MEIITKFKHQPLDVTAEPAQVFMTAIFREAVPVLSLMDREPMSPTQGCMDRTYWAWKFTDFPGARFQEGLCFLSFLYSTAREDNPYFQQQKLLQWIASGFDYWSSIQYSRGEFDEAYPFERSLAATAFTSYYLAEAWKFLDGALPAASDDRFRQSLKKAGDWLIKNDERHGFLSNHLAAAAAALYHIYLITGDSRYADRSSTFISRILEHQSTEGWYEEYGGADPGYQTHGAFYLARYHQLSDDDRLVGSLERSLNFLAHFVHPDGSLGGEYASRNTQTYYPAAFEMLSGTSNAARWIAETMLPSVFDLAAAGLGTVDAYNYFPLLNNYVFAYLACLQPDHHAAKPQPPSPEPGIIHFPKAGILKIRSIRYDLFIGTAKGGVLKLFDRPNRRLVHNDCGYIGRLKNGRMFSNQWFEKDRPVSVAGDEIVIKGKFYQINHPVMRPLSFLGFRAFSLTFGRFPQFSYWLKSLLVKILIYRKRDLDLNFERRIKLSDDQVVVIDYLQGGMSKQIATLWWSDLFTTIHMGSSRYFLPNELIQSPAGDRVEVPSDELEDGVTIVRTIPIA